MADSGARPASRIGIDVRAVLGVVAWLFVACLVVQFFLVGLAAFEADASELHRTFPYIYGWLAPGLVLLAGLTGQRRALWLAVALLVLFGVQTYLPTFAESLPDLAALHAVNAFAIVWVAVALAREATRLPAGDGTPDR